MNEQDFLARLHDLRAEHESRVVAARNRADRWHAIKAEAEELVGSLGRDRFRMGVEKETHYGLQAQMQGQLGRAEIVDPLFTDARQEAKNAIGRLVAEYVSGWGLE